MPGAQYFTGRCLHPARQLPCDPQPWVRHRELACRLEWDRDLWEASGIEDDQLLDIRTLDPEEPGPGSNGSVRNILQRLLILSDLPLSPTVREVLIDQELNPEFAEEEPALAPSATADELLTLQRTELLQRFWRRRP
jgi:hypothetical protein